MRLANQALATLAILLGGQVLTFQTIAQETFRVTGVARGDELNVRAGPDGAAAIVGTIPPGAGGVRRVGPCSDWCQVQYGAVTGWVSRRYLKTDDQSRQSTTRRPSFSKELRAALRHLTERGIIVAGDRVEAVGDGQSVIVRRGSAEFSISPVPGSASIFQMRNTFGEQITQVNLDGGEVPDEMLICVEPLVAVEGHLRAQIDGTPERTKELGEAIAFLYRRFCRLVEEAVEEEQREQVTDTCHQVSGTYRDETVFWKVCGD